MTNATADPPALAEWGERADPPTGAAPAYLAAGLAVGLLAALLAALSRPLGLAALVLGAGGLVWFAATRGAAALKAAAARPAEKDEFPRVANLMTGLASDLGITSPALWVVPGSEGGSNAMVTWRGRPVVAVTEGLEERFTRTECEALLAHCLVRLASGEARATTLRAGFGPFGPSGKEAAAADIPSAARTRYPPALASALEKTDPRSGTFAALWFVPDAGGDASPARRAARIKAL